MTVPHQVALTGATGFIGSALLPRLVAGGWSVRALYRPRPGGRRASMPGVVWVEGDLDDERSLRELVTGAEAVVHCAGAVRGSGAAQFQRVNADGTRRLVEVAARLVVAPRFLLVSSLAARMPNLSAYAASKRKAELALERAPAGLRWTVIRPPAVYGPGDRELLPLFRWVARGVAPLPAGGGGRFSLLYVEDLAFAVLRWLDADTGYGRTFEVDDSHRGGYDWDTVLAAASRVLRSGARVRRLPIPLSVLKLAASANVAAARLVGYSPMLTPGKIREITHPDWLCDSHDFETVMGWRATIGLDEGLARGYGRRVS